MARRPPLILIPGLLCAPSLFSRVLPLLQSRLGREILTPTATHGDAASISSAARAIVDLGGGGKVLLAGLSYGGYIALEALRIAPSRVCGVALIHSHPRVDADAVRERRLALRALVREKGLDALLTTIAAQAALLLHPSHLPLDAGLRVAAISRGEVGSGSEWPVFDAFVAGACEVGVEGFLHQQSQILSRISTEDVLRASTVPVAVITGSHDGIVPPALAESTAALSTPHAALTIIPECGHLSSLESPAALADALVAWAERCE